MIWIIAIASLLAVSSGGQVLTAAADDDAPRRLAVTVGETVEMDVGHAIGFRCDDPKLIEAEMKTRSETNVFVVKGVAVGTTLCRVGTDLQRPGVLLDVHVIAKRWRRPGT